MTGPPPSRDRTPTASSSPNCSGRLQRSTASRLDEALAAQGIGTEEGVTIDRRR